MMMETIQKDFQKILNSDDSAYFNILQKNVNYNKEAFLSKSFHKYRIYSDRKGPQPLFGTKILHGMPHMFLNIDKESFIKNKDEHDFLTLYKNGVIFTEGEFFVF